MLRVVPRSSPRRALALVSGAFVVGCTLTTSLQGYSNGADPDDGGPSTIDGGGGKPDGGSDGAPDAPGTSAYALEVLADKPLGFWRLGEASGTKAKDEMGAHDGAYMGGVKLGVPGALPGDPSTAASFDGTSAYLRIGETFEFRGTSHFSIEMWVNPTDASIERRLASRRTGSPSTGYRFFMDGMTRLERWQDGGIIGSAAVTALPKLGRWTHLVATYDGSRLRLFVDGTKSADVDSSGSITTASAAFVWASNSVTDGNWFAGTLDELAVYDHALSGDRVAAHVKAAGR